MNAYVAWALVGVAVCAAVAVAVYVLQSGWPLLGLTAIPSLRSK